MKRGFTLIEVMATIVILAVVLLIAVPIYNGVREGINESIYKSKIKEVVAKAESYASETNNSVFDVKTLIEDGRISADNETGIYVDPRTNRDMRCDVINAVYKEGRYEISITESNTCYSLEELENIYGIVELVLENEAGEEIENIEGTQWLKEQEVYVRYKIKGSYQEYEQRIKSILWYGEEEKSCNKENINECLRYKVRADLIKNSVINLQIKFEVAGVEIIAQNQKNILLDLQRPGVVDGSIKVNNEASTINERKVEFEISDGNGSGVKEYAILNTSNCESMEYEEKKQSSEGGIEEAYLNNGEYYICVKDKVGNISSEEATRKTYFKVENVDQSKDRIDYEIESYTKGVNEWYQAITIRGNVDEKGSGIDKVISCVTTGNTCEPNEIENISKNGFSKKLSSNSNAQRICARVIDKAGNVSEIYCSSAYKVDEINPSASVSINSNTSGSNGWYKALSIKANLSDNHSGISSAKYCITTGSTCTPSTKASISNNSFSVTLQDSVSAQRVCVNTTDKSGRTSSTVCSNAYKVDTKNPSVSWGISSSTSGSNGWYKALSIKAVLSDSGSGVASAKYCTTTGSTCTPNTSAGISNNQITVTLGSNASAQKVCANVTDKSGRTSSTICSSSYKIDTKNPTAKISLSTFENTITVSANGSSDSHSGIASYQYSRDNKTWYSSSKNTYTFSGLTDGTYTIYVKVIDKAGRVSSVESAKIMVQTITYLYDSSKNIMGDWIQYWIQWEISPSSFQVTKNSLYVQAYDDYTIHDEGYSGSGGMGVASEVIDLTNINTIYLNYSYYGQGSSWANLYLIPESTKVENASDNKDDSHWGTTYYVNKDRKNGVKFFESTNKNWECDTVSQANNVTFSYDVSGYTGNWRLIITVGAGSTYECSGSHIGFSFKSIYGKK